jgi:hypothetical protein
VLDIDGRPAADLREALLRIKASGDSGFEGLIAEALAAFSGLTFRLAKSGSQFGRDASSPDAPFAIAIEAKRYDGDLRLENLAGKATIAAYALGGRMDVWALGATSEVGDDTLAKLTQVLEERGITLLALDWAARPLPPLAVLLATEKPMTLAWFQRHYPNIDSGEIGAHLDAIAADGSFESQVKILRNAVSGASVGMDALRRRAGEWLRKRLADRRMSQLDFGQYITVNDESSPAYLRSNLVRTLRELAVVDTGDIPVIAVLGGEGVGKTWLVAQWWQGLAGSPVMLLVAGRQADCIVPGRPLASLARLIARQAGSAGEISEDGWQRRLERWKEHGAEKYLRFVVVLDGLNEQVARPWADLIRELAKEAQALGGLVIVTCREAFWQREVRPRLQGSVDLKELTVAGYDDEELASVLGRKNIHVSDLSAKLREFLRNPRVCNVALSLVRRLAVQPNELTVERLLMEYWQARLQERGDLIAHNIQDFEKLLRMHARAWREQPKRRFDRDDWKSFSGPARRLDVTRVQNDLTEIEEGRFLQIAADDSGAYEFRSEVMPYALGLLINAELKEELRKSGEPEEQLAKLFETIQGFDLLADIIAAAVGLACLDDGFPPRGRSALIEAWLALQNIDGPAVEAMAGYVPARPDAFLDAAEGPGDRVKNAARSSSLLAMLMAKRDHPAVRMALGTRLPKWMGRWSRRIRQFSDAPEKGAKYEKDIDAKLLSLSKQERSEFDRLTVEVPVEDGVRLDFMAACLLAGRPLRLFGDGFYGWALAHAVAMAGDAYEDLAWIIRLNPVDWPETTAAIKKITDGIHEASANAMKVAASIALYLPGDRCSAERSSRLSPAGQGRSWRLVETFCETDPHDPEAPPGANLQNARQTAAAAVQAGVWLTSGHTLTDTHLEMVIPALARFDPPVIVRALREALSTASDRAGLGLRRLSFRLLEMAPLIDRAVMTSVQQAYDLLLKDKDRVAAADRNWVATSLVRAMTPHLTAEEQLDVLLSLPDDCPPYLNLRRGLRHLPADTLEARLAASLERPRDLGRILFFASACKPELTPRARAIIALSLNDPDPTVSISAAEIICVAQDAELYDLVLDQGIARYSAGDDQYSDWMRSCAFAAAVAARNREDLIDRLPPRTLDLVAAEMGGRALDLLAEYIERVLSRLLEPVAAKAPGRFEAFLETSEDGFHLMRRVEAPNQNGHPASARDTESEFKKLSAMANNPEAALRRESEHYECMIREMEAYERALIHEGASEMFMSPPRRGLNELVRRHSARGSSWIAAILATRDGRVLSQIRNIGLSLAGAWTTNNPDQAAALFRHLTDQPPTINVLIGLEEIPLYEYTLFTAAEAEPIAALRREAIEGATNDAVLQALVTAAEVCGATDWLCGYIEQAVCSVYPAAQARALTLAGFRQPNDATDRILNQNWGTGFLASAADAARESYQRAAWARHWLEEANRTCDPVDFWRFGTLAVGVADIRCLAYLRKLACGEVFRSYGAELVDRLKKSAKDRTEKRRKTLFGHSAPRVEIAIALHDQGENSGACVA